MASGGTKKKWLSEDGQAAVEAVFSVLIVLLLILAAMQVLYTFMISTEAMKRAHEKAIAFFRDVNENHGYDVYTVVEKVEGKVEVSADTRYAAVIKGWTLFHKDHKPERMPDTEFGPGKYYRSVRGLIVAAGPLKGVGLSAFGVPRGSKPFPDSDGDGYNTSGEATRKDELNNLCAALGIEEDCHYFE